MNTIFFAGLFGNNPLPGFEPMGSVMKERLMVVGAVLFVALVALVWAFLFRRKRRRAARREERHHRRQSFTKSATRGVAEIKRFVEDQQHRGRRRRHRPRNPTLAETGGLPPFRDRKDDQPPQTQPH